MDSSNLHVDGGAGVGVEAGIGGVDVEATVPFGFKCGWENSGTVAFPPPHPVTLASITANPASVIDSPLTMGW